MLKISDITKFTLQDYPENTACIIWFAGCNMRCKFCHNAEFLEQNNGFLTEDYVLSFLKKRVGLFDGVVLSGGECTISDGFYNFVKNIKELGFKIKIDTNGLNYDMVVKLVEEKLIDFVALDFKGPRDKFSNITQIQTNMYDVFFKTLQFLIENNNKNNVDLEIRTTVHTELLQEDDINKIINILDDLKYSKTYYIQNFRNDNKVILVDLGNQKFLIDKIKIKTPVNFKVDYRNFF
ncbi:MAG: anaerobic ribonucleoside-triphosphate reductase activating protein [Rickettsiales bacterium]|nr:anaerobic ribonucleoside-triphosphate reductase activating protein [Rickettsiales bacterium]